MISGSKARLGYMCPVDGLRQPRPPPRGIARVGGHRRQPVLNNIILAVTGILGVGAAPFQGRDIGIKNWTS